MRRITINNLKKRNKMYNNSGCSPFFSLLFKYSLYDVAMLNMFNPQ